MNTNELLNPNLHLTFTVKLDCDNNHWRRNAADNADGDAVYLEERLKDALREAAEGVLQSELGKESTAFADYSCEVVDDDKTPIYAYRWGDDAPKWCKPEPDFDDTPARIRQQEKKINGLSWTHCYPMANGEDTHYILVLVTTPDGDCAWRIYDDDTHEELDSDEGCELDCQLRFEEIMEEASK